VGLGAAEAEVAEPVAAGAEPEAEAEPEAAGAEAEPVAAGAVAEGLPVAVAETGAEAETDSAAMTVAAKARVAMTTAVNFMVSVSGVVGGWESEVMCWMKKKTENREGKREVFIPQSKSSDTHRFVFCLSFSFVAHGERGRAW